MKITIDTHCQDSSTALTNGPSNDSNMDKRAEHFFWNYRYFLLNTAPHGSHTGDMKLQLHGCFMDVLLLIISRTYPKTGWTDYLVILDTETVVQ